MGEVVTENDNNSEMKKKKSIIHPKQRKGQSMLCCLSVCDLWDLPV